VPLDVLIIADDLQQRGVDSGTGTRGADAPAPAPAPANSREGRGGRGRGGRGHGRVAFADRVQRAAANQQPNNSQTGGEDHGQSPEHQPSAVEAAANQASLDVIKQLYGSRARTLMNILLAFDGYFAWFYPFKQSIPYDSDVGVREARALDNCRRAIDMQEIFERVSIYNHGSFLPH